MRDAAQLLWIVNLGCIELHPHPVRADDLDHPDELRIDLDPGPGVAWADVRTVAATVREVLEEQGLRGWPKTSGSRGMHVNVRIERRWTFEQVRRAALAVAREVERRQPERATSKWWKERAPRVFLDYNQNPKDRTVPAWSVRPTPDARISMPLDWDGTGPRSEFNGHPWARFAEHGDPASHRRGRGPPTLARAPPRTARGLNAPCAALPRKAGEPGVAPSAREATSPPRAGAAGQH